VRSCSVTALTSGNDPSDEKDSMRDLPARR
jgi:hypothetical protein